jgi:iron complex transport system substrate-binding protein
MSQPGQGLPDDFLLTPGRKTTGMFPQSTLPGRFVLILIHGVLAVLVLLTWLVPATQASPEGQGRQVLSPTPPQRLVSLAPSITEILYFLELGDRVVGVTSFCNYPPPVKNKPRIGTYWEFNLEAILALKPDLVLAMAHQGEGESSLNVLSHWKIPYYVGHADTLPQLFRLIEDIARLTGAEDVARRKLPALEARVRRVEARVQGLPRPRVFMEIDQEPLITVGRSSIQGDLIQRAGGENIAHGIDQRYPVFSLEKVLMARPDIILFTGMAGATTFPARKKFWRKWDMLPAVKAGRLLWIDPDLVDRPGPRLVDGLELLANFFHPQK